MKPRVLVVDDSITVRMDLRAALSTAGFSVSTCGTRDAALAALRTQALDLAILDIVLPDGSGIDVLTAIKQTPELRSIRVFMLSSQADVEARLLGLKLGADLYVGKPYDRGYVARAAREMFKMADHAGPPTSRRSLSHRKILLVDDSPTFVEALAIALRQDGNQIVTASSGEDALALLLVERFDCVLIDQVMPGLDGLETCMRLRAIPSMARVPVALMTASPGVLPITEVLAVGADELFDKNTDLEALRHQLRGLFVRKRQATPPNEELPRPHPEPSRAPAAGPAESSTGAALYQSVVSASGLSALMAKTIIGRALSRVGVTQDTLESASLLRALPHIRESLLTFMSPRETMQRVDAIAALVPRSDPSPES